MPPSDEELAARRAEKLEKQRLAKEQEAREKALQEQAGQAANTPQTNGG